MAAKRYVYDFDEPADGGKELLGGKGAGLAEMTQLGVPVPAGFTVTTEACRAYMASGNQLPDGLEEEIEEHLAALEEDTSKRFGDAEDPLLVSVRSGAAVSMPGMMDTILNLGLNDEAVQGLAGRTGNARFAHDSYRRLIQMYGEVVDDIDAHRFEQALTDLKAARGASQDVDLTAEDLAELIETFKRIYREGTGSDFAPDAREQLRRAVRAVFDSWDTPRAQVYRRAHHIPDDLGTAVNVVQMVFGNKGDDSGTGVAFTRDPATGESGLYGEFLPNAQGEDVVAGIRTPQPLEQMKDVMPQAFEQLLDTMRRLEEHYRDMQDIEFTVEDGELYLLQTRSAKRTAAAAVKAAVAMVDEGLISREEAVARIDVAQLDQLLHPMLDPKAEFEVAAKGLNASPGAASGKIVFDADAAEEKGKAGESVILVRWETTPDDIHGLIQAAGILTAHGGMTSHAAVVARGMGKPCVAGCEDLSIDARAKTARLGGHDLSEGDVLTIDGGTGRVIVGEVPLVPPQINEDFETILEWADDLRRLRVRANADTPEDATKAREFGAQGIGLCRTEHMFMAEDRLPVVREMIMAEDEEGRRAALDRLLPMQQGDFERIFEAMAGLPVTIRLLDPPLHEFLPPEEEAADDRMRHRIRALREANPMLGTRGCRLGLQWPEIYEMQVRAIVRAAAAVEERTGDAPLVEIMHPLVGFAEELRRLRALTVSVADQEAPSVEYLCGTMIELPRACMRADEIAEHADFFSFGTNDLTQTALGFSRDDAEGKFLTYYLEHGVLERNPFETLDVGGVGDLMRVAVERGRAAREDLKLGICGEHGGEAASVAFCHELGLDYVSCSPYRVPLARLAAAQAALRESGVEAVAAGG
ncbi:MAG TPA: pyruvate, phosphate dikinase [Gaiellaceae bacterium]|jgi:pyruvate,orthophosphate dikinase|nr:pyruvate, phosphate dikinase [Gaiellaceae bacterium]